MRIGTNIYGRYVDGSVTQGNVTWWKKVDGGKGDNPDEGWRRLVALYNDDTDDTDD